MRRLRYYPVWVGVFVTTGLVGLAWVRAQPPEPQNELDEVPDRFVALLMEEPPAEASEGARAKREEGRVGKRDQRMTRSKGNKVEAKHKELDRQLRENAGVLGALRDAGDLDGMFGSAGLDADLRGGIGGLIGAKGTQVGIGGLGARGSGLGGAGHGLGGGGYMGLPDGALGHTRQLAKEWTDHGLNKVELAEQDMLSTFSIDVDTASYTQARRQLNSSRVPPTASVRTEEFVNYFVYDYPEPERGQAFSITMDGARHPWAPKHHLLRVGLKGATPPPAQRVPLHLTFLVDVSGSMQARDKLPLLKESLTHLVNGLGATDTVALVTYAGATRVVLPATSAGNKARILHALDRLRSGGGTAMSGGMELAYQQAESSFVAGHENRVIVLSDGDANIGPSSHQAILDRLAHHAGRGITLSTVGFGQGNYRDTLMEQLADKGDGNASYIDSMEEARRVFGEDLGATLTTIARDVKIQVEFDPEQVMTYRLLGYENRAIADKDFRNDKVDAGEIGAGHTVTALYSVILRDEITGPLATVRVRHKAPGPDRPAVEQAVTLPAAAVDKSIWDSSRDLRRAVAVAGFAEKLRHAPWTAELSWTDLIEAMDSARRPGDSRDVQALSLMKQAAVLAPDRSAVAQSGR